MGNNRAYTEFEAITIGIYNLGKLDNEVLTVIMEAYSYCDIDSGGSQDLESVDGKNVEQIVIEMFGGTYPTKPNLPDDHPLWNRTHVKQNDAFHDTVSDAFYAITKRFNWE